ncbi:hypothetical protein OIU78_008999 [Salix suchowensis]|nr:hypothetical protein OIU78_008999 [Salix suchowensis]
MVHGFDNSKDMALVASQELILELRRCLLSFDRAGYGESDPNPDRSVKSDTFDIQELADKLQLGSNFYVGGYPTWGCLKYIPNRLAGAALVVPIVNYWWPSFPAHLSREAYKRQLQRDQWKLRIAHYTMIRQQGVVESLHRDLMVGFENWEFDPMELSNPFPLNESFVHIWQGFEDPLAPVKLQQYVCRKQQWIRYHEVADGGHLIVYDTNLFAAILRELLLPSSV